jgi:hypothetical protein
VIKKLIITHSIKEISAAEQKLLANLYYPYLLLLQAVSDYLFSMHLNLLGPVNNDLAQVLAEDPTGFIWQSVNIIIMLETVGALQVSRLK